MVKKGTRIGHLIMNLFKYKTLFVVPGNMLISNASEIICCPVFLYLFPNLAILSLYISDVFSDRSLF